jgi:hypothetical protein
MRFFSAADNRWLRARPPLRPKALAISEAFMAPIVLSAKQKMKGWLLISQRGRVQQRARRHGIAGIYTGNAGIVECATCGIY